MSRGGEEDGARVAGAAFGLRPRARKLAGGPPGAGGARAHEGSRLEGSSRPAPRPDGGNLGMRRVAVPAWRPPGGPGKPLRSTQPGLWDLLARPPVALGPWEQGNERAEAVAALAAFSFH